MPDPDDQIPADGGIVPVSPQAVLPAPAVPARPSVGDRLAAPWRPDRRRRTILRLCAGVLATAAVVGGSVALGWWWAASTIVAESSSPDPEVIEVPVSSLVEGAIMPDVRGLDPDLARQVLADSGIPAGIVEVTEQPAAGPSGVVVQQTPVFGSITPSQVALVVSTPAEMPSLVGATESDAVNGLLALGAAVEVVEVYRPGDALGVVVATEPAAGEVVPASVAVKVTAPPATAALAELKRSSGCSTVNPAVIGNTDYPDSLSCSSRTQPRRVMWEVAGAVDRVTATLGLDSGADAGARATVMLVGDGTQLGQWDLAPRGEARIDVVTTGVQRLEFVFSATAHPGTGVLVGTPTAYGARVPISDLLRR